MHNRSRDIIRVFRRPEYSSLFLDIGGQVGVMGLHLEWYAETVLGDMSV